MTEEKKSKSTAKREATQKTPRKRTPKRVPVDTVPVEGAVQIKSVRFRHRMPLGTGDEGAGLGVCDNARIGGSKGHNVCTEIVTAPPGGGPGIYIRTSQGGETFVGHAQIASMDRAEK